MYISENRVVLPTQYEHNSVARLPNLASPTNLWDAGKVANFCASIYNL